MLTLSPPSRDSQLPSLAFQSVDDLFRVQAEATPDAAALIFRGATFSYAALDEAVERLARRLVSLGIGPERAVALGLPRSPGMIVGMLATLRAGGAYLPLELAHPPARNALLIRDSRAAVLVTAAGDGGLPHDPGHPVPRVMLQPEDGDMAEPGTLPGSLWPALHPDNLAALLYTSGSTGTPKAVAVTQGNIVSFAYKPDFVPLGPGSRVLHLASPAFDATTFEVLAPLLSGACVVVIPHGVPDMNEVASIIRQSRVDTMWLTVGLFRHIAEEHPELFFGVRWLLTGGEAVPPASVRRVAALSPGTRVIDGYGPTETTTFASTHLICPRDLDGDNIPIGSGIRGGHLFILNDRMQPVAQGETGMLYIAGDGLTRGYAGRPALTAERFLPCPFGPPGGRMYMSGDLARWRPDGTVEYRGRADQQVKLRGLRIEPGEIEHGLLASGDLAQAVVAPREIAGDARLIAWIVPRQGGDPPPGEDVLRARLAATLPDFMIPSAFVVIDRLPLTPSGKVDRAALPIPALADATHEPPVGECEATIAGHFAALTGTAAVGRHADFFRIGGNSLLAMRLVARLRAETGIAVPLGAVFRNPTAAGLAPLLRNPVRAGWSPLIPLRREGAARPLFCVHPATGLAAGFKTLADALGERHPVWGLQARGLEGDETPQASIAEMVQSYVPAVRTVQSGPPFVLLGWSLGGIIAQAMACRLERDGAPVALVVCLDSAVPAVAALDHSGDQRFAEEMLIRIASGDPGARARLARKLHAASVSRGLIPPETPTIWGELLMQQINLAKVRLASHAPEVCRAPILLFRAAGNPLADSHAAFDWSPFTTGGVTDCVLDCEHNTILEPHAAAEIADRLRPFLP